MNYGGYKLCYQRSTSETEVYLQTTKVIQIDGVVQVISKILSIAKFTLHNNLYVYIYVSYIVKHVHMITHTHHIMSSCNVHSFM